MANSLMDYTADGYVLAPDYTPVSIAGNQVPGAAAVTDPYTVAPDYTVYGGYDPNAIGSTGGGYDPNNPSYGIQASGIGGDVAITQNYNLAPNFDPAAAGPGGYDPSMGDSIYTGGGFDPTTAGLSDPSNARLAKAGLLPGGDAGLPSTDPSVMYQTATGPNGAATPADTDWRVRISLADNATIFYKNAGASSTQNQLMQPLIETNGVIFPYTPQINITHSANYSPVNPTHSNYPMHFYNNSEVSDVSITGDFTVQSVAEGQYLMAAVYFFRACTKMFFGSGENAGNPPPIVFLDGYGSHYFPHVPCVISSFSHVLSPEVDYIEIPTTSTTLITTGSTSSYQSSTTTTRVPTTSSITLTLKPVYSRKNLHNRFDLNKFAAGQLLRDPGGTYGGFL